MLIKNTDFTVSNVKTFKSQYQTEAHICYTI